MLKFEMFLVAVAVAATIVQAITIMWPIEWFEITQIFVVVGLWVRCIISIHMFFQGTDYNPVDKYVYDLLGIFILGSVISGLFHVFVTLA